MSEIITKKPAQWEDAEDDYDSEEGEAEIGLTPTTIKNQEELKQPEVQNSGQAERGQVITN